MTDTGDEPARYVLSRLPDPGLEAAERRRWRQQWQVEVLTCALLGFMTVLSVGLLAFEIAYGTFSTVMSAALLLAYAAIAGWRSWTGSPGVRGRYHLATPTACAMSVEDGEREWYRRKAEGVVVVGVSAADTAEYLRLQDLMDRGITLRIGAWDRMEALTGAPAGPDREGASGPHVE